ncbi:MAG: hypothetical protein HKN26_13660, partial [Acidimicrobiales bacterium]|nr:hypothetical protein [Acidimicrobiales bacterium]
SNTHINADFASPVTGPNSTTTPNQAGTAIDMAQLESNRDLWLSLEIQCYTAELELNRAPEVAGDWTFVIRDGWIVEPDPDPTFGEAGMTEFFAHIDDGLRMGEFVTASFDPTYGYPMTFVIGMPDPNTPDGTFSGGVLAFEPDIC